MTWPYEPQEPDCSGIKRAPVRCPGWGYRCYIYILHILFFFVCFVLPFSFCFPTDPAESNYLLGLTFTWPKSGKESILKASWESVGVETVVGS